MKDEVEVIKTVQHGEVRYYLKPTNKKYQFYPSAEIPKKLWNEYVEVRETYSDYAKQIKNYFKFVEDKPMYITKNHVVEETDREIRLDAGSVLTKIKEGETHRVNEDGSITIKKRK